jgi:hypothetical protein
MRVFARLIVVSAIIAAPLLLTRQADCATADSAVVVVDKVAKTAGKDAITRLALGLDHDGNVMIRYGRTSLTMIYGPEGTADEMRIRSGLTPPIKESAGMGEMSFKVSFAF